MNDSLTCSYKTSQELLDYCFWNEEETTIIFELRFAKHQKPPQKKFELKHWSKIEPKLELSRSSYTTKLLSMLKVAQQYLQQKDQEKIGSKIEPKLEFKFPMCKQTTIDIKNNLIAPTIVQKKKKQKKKQKTKKP
jgi:hypothetical protein